MDAGPQKILRATQSAHRIGESIAELPEIIRRSIGKFVVSLGPYVFGGIEFRSVGREAVHEKSGMAGEESPDFATAMDRPAIPEQVDGTTDMPQQVLEERADVQATEISWPTS